MPVFFWVLLVLWGVPFTILSMFLAWAFFTRDKNED